MPLKSIIAKRVQLNRDLRFKLNMTATRPVPVYPANVGGLRP